MATNVYIDGFNLYYRALAGKADKRWLDLQRLCAECLPRESINQIRYFTARVSARYPGDADPQRQELYLRALSSIPNLTVHLGTFLTNTKTMKNASPPPDFVTVLKTEEKGSDVNLASYLLLDAFQGNADTFVVVSNDTDLVTPLRMVREDLGQRTGALYPHKSASGALHQANPSFARVINPGKISKSQFPNVVPLPDGSQVEKPQNW